MPPLVAWACSLVEVLLKRGLDCSDRRTGEESAVGVVVGGKVARPSHPDAGDIEVAGGLGEYVVDRDLRSWWHEVELYS